MHHTVFYPVPTTLRIGALVEWTSIHEQYTLEGTGGAVAYPIFSSTWYIDIVSHVIIQNSFAGVARKTTLLMQ